MIVEKTELATHKICKVFLLSKNYDAITFYRWIFYRNMNAYLQLSGHELAHVKQYKKYPVSFLFRYIWFSIKYGYLNNPFEVEAREANKVHK